MLLFLQGKSRPRPGRGKTDFSREAAPARRAAALDVSRQSVSKWETNPSVPELDQLVLGERTRAPEAEPPQTPSPQVSPPEAPPPRSSAGAIAQNAVGWMLLVIFAAAAWVTLPEEQILLQMLRDWAVFALLTALAAVRVAQREPKT